MKIDIDKILLEWSYRCDKGFPDLDNHSDMFHLQTILEEEGIQTPFAKLSEAPVLTTSKPITSTNDTSTKEGLVCMFFDCFKNKKLQADIIELQTLKRSKIGKGVDISKHPKIVPTLKEITKVFHANIHNYGVGKTAVKNLDEYVKYVWNSGEELDTLNNAMSAAAAIHKTVTVNGTIIREKKFDLIREHAVKLLKQDYSLSLFADNWCPGDVYIIRNDAAVAKSLTAKSLNVIPGSNLNANFGKTLTEKTGILAISLKEQRAQAGKASTFNDTVFKKDYKATINPKQALGTSNNKDTVKITASVTRFNDYMNGSPKRKKSFINAISKSGKIHKSVNTILVAGGFPPIKSTDIIFSTNEAKFYADNKQIFTNIQAAIEKTKGKFADESHVKDTLKQFIASRNAFIVHMKALKVEVETVKSATFATDIEKSAKPADVTSIFSMKTATYELATTIIDKWKTDIENISPAYKKIATMTNPFVALTAFAIAEAGVSPSFWKVIGSERGPIGHASYFDTNDVIDIDTKTSSIKLVDTVGQSGFNLRYVVSVGSKKYQTQLDFRFASGTIRIEVTKMVAI